MTKNPVDNAQAARRDVERAQSDLTAAQNKLATARDELDRALAGVGWHRLRGLFSPDATPRYQHAVYPEATLEADAVLEILEQQRRIAA
jgi:hypothetical protein